MTAVNPMQSVEPVSRQAWLTLAIAALSTFLVVVDASALNVAFPSIQENLRTTPNAVGWVLTSYNVTVGALVLIAGRLADSFGRRRTFLSGIAVFGLGSAAAASSPTIELLIAARVGQAVGGAIISGAAFAVVLGVFPSHKHSLAIGVAGAAGALGAVLGPIIAAVIIEATTWRAVFAINLPACLFALWAGPRIMAETRDPDATGNIDIPSIVVGATSIATVLFAITKTDTWGISDPRLGGLALAGLIALGWLVHRSHTHNEPLVNTALFTNNAFRSANIANLLYGLALTSGLLVNSLVLQNLWGQSLIVTGLALAPAPIMAALISVYSPKVFARYGYRNTIAAGAILCGAANIAAVIALGNAATVATRLIPISVISGIGTGLTVAAFTSAALATTPPNNVGVALATCNSIRQIGYAIGIAAVLALIGSNPDSISDYRRAWMWVAAAFTATAAVIAATYPRRETEAS